MSQIYHLDDLDEFLGGDEWKISIDITDIWNTYSTEQIDILTFNGNYKTRLLEYKKEILQLGNDVWNDLVPLINKMIEKKTETELYPLYDDIYSWADKNDILIKTK